MKPGRELDVIIAETVLGHSVVKQKNGALMEGTPQGTRPLPNYSKDVGAAWAVVERLGVTVLPINDGSYFAMVGNGHGWRSPAEFVESLSRASFMESGAAVAETAPLAICLAGLKAMEKRGAAEVSATQLQ